MQSTSLVQPTALESRRMGEILDLGCLACILKTKILFTPAEIHHLISGGKRIGHAATVALCAWHHRGMPVDGFSEHYTRKVKGPSMAKNPAEFKEAFGDDVELLEKQNKILGRSRMAAGTRAHLWKIRNG